MFSILTIAWITVQVIVGYNLLMPFILSVIYSLSFSSKRKNTDRAQEQLDYAVIITAYQYTETLTQTVQSALKLNYENYVVYVVADNCDISLLNFDHDRVVLLKPETVLRSNTKSHFYAIDRFERNHDIVTIIDSDNLVHPEYLNELNNHFSQGFEAVQGLREPKNLDTIYARLDAARDIYYHYFDCKLLFNCGSSATLSGSGMAFTIELYKECLQGKTIIGAGFDKVLQAEIVLRDKRIAFAPLAIVYDEKTSHPEELVNQRSRWINTWFKYSKLGFRIVTTGVKNFSFNQILFGITLLRPPLFLFLVLSFLMMLANLRINAQVSMFWLLGFSIFTLSFIIALLASNTDKRIYKSLIGIPKFILFQLISLTKIRRANIRSVSTRHNHL